MASSPSTATLNNPFDMASISSSPESDTIHTFTPMGTMEDFFNFDLLSGPSADSSSRSSSRSPQANLWSLPLQPLSPKIAPASPIDPSAVDPMFQGLYTMDKEKPELFTFLDNPMGFSPSAFTNIQSFDGPTLAIDPQLTANSPSTSGNNSSPSDSKHASLSSNEDEEEETIEEEESELNAVTHRVHKVGGKGKSRKGTVASGGIRKNNIPLTQAVRREDEPEDEDDWRPTAEEYSKMSSKEKRQLRNKISARNFRVRRKEYISTLEGDIAQRDSLIDIIRTELSSTKMENQSLRREVESLKKALLKGGVKPNLPPPAPLSETIPVAALKDSNTPATPKRQTALATANTQKDLPLSPRMGGNAFWGGRSAFPGAGVTPVHATLIPDFSPFIPDKLAARAKAQTQEMGPSNQENINPNLNSNPFFGIGHMPKEKASNFEGYTDANSFNFRNMDSYRMHLWTKMGNRPVSNANTSTHGFFPSSNMYNSNSSLASQLKPSYFASPNNKTLKDSESSSKKSTPPTHTPQQAVIASIVSQTFVQKLSSAFWDAFTSPASKSKDWDVEKVRRVIEGKAVLRVVDVPSSTKKSSDGVDALEQSLKDLAISSQKGVSSSSSRSSPPIREKMMLRPEPCFLTGLRSGTSPLSSKK